MNGDNLTANMVNIRRELTIKVPDGMVATTDPALMPEGAVFTMVTEGTAFKAVSGAKRGLVLAAPQEVGVEELDLKTPRARDNLVKAVEGLVVRLMGEGSGCRCLKTEDELMVFCGYKNSGFASSIRFVIVTPAAIYNGQVFTAEAKSPEEQQNTAEAILMGVETYDPTGTGEFMPADFKAPEGADAPRVRIAAFTVPMPGNMITLDDLSDAESAPFRTTYAFAAVPKAYADGIPGYKHAPVTILVQHGEEIRGWQKNAQLADKYKLMAQVVELLNDGLRKAGREELEEITRTEDFLVAFAEGAEKVRGRTYRSGYTWFVFYDGTLWQGIFHVNHTGDKKAVREEIHRWLCGVKPAAYWEIQAYEDALRRKVLGEYLGQDGKMDAVKAAKLFARDVCQNGAEDIVLDDGKYVMTGLQFNDSALSRYQRIKDNTSVFSREIMRVANFVELNQSMRLNGKYIHRNLREELCEREFTGMAAFNLCSWRMIDIEENGDDEYIVYLDQNLVRAIPECYNYAAEFLRTLRAYNGKRSDFRLIITTEFNLASPVSEIESPVPGADDWETGKAFTVSGAEHPYKGVCDRVEENRHGGPAASTSPWRMKVTEDGNMGVLGYRGTDADVAIPESWDSCTVTEICDEAFSPIREGASYAEKTACSAMASIIVPGTVRKIGNRAFAGCSELKTAVVSDGVQVVGDGAFSDCTNLCNVTMPSHRIATGKDIFSGCTALKEPVKLDNSVDDTLEEGEEDLSELLKMFGFGEK